MFNNQRYITRGVSNNIQPWLIIYIWSMVDSFCRDYREEVDYLQIFKISTENNVLTISHSQEQPAIENLVKLSYYGTPINEKIYVIDSEEYSTMLLAEEY